MRCLGVVSGSSHRETRTEESHRGGTSTLREDAPRPLVNMPSGVADPSVASEAHCLFCFDVLSAHLKRKPAPHITFRADVHCPLFVTWSKRPAHGSHFQLRGCIGCLKPLPLASLRDYALTSALHDRRFAPIDQSELYRLQCTVQLLGGFEPCATTIDWTIGVHGITISFVDREGGGLARSAVYLPDVIPEQGWSKVEAIDSLIRKSGCEQPITEQLRARLDVTRFISTKYSVAHEAWVASRAPQSQAIAWSPPPSSPLLAPLPASPAPAPLAPPPTAPATSAPLPPAPSQTAVQPVPLGTAPVVVLPAASLPSQHSQRDVA